jgi:16S rRNA processing protein RimM
MIDLSDYRIAGTITKTHGVHGQIILQLNNFSFEDILIKEAVFIEMDGLPVPFFIEEITQRNNNSVILKIDDISTEEKAREFIEKQVFVKPVRVQKKIKSLDKSIELIGFEVIDKIFGKIGILDEILDSQFNPLLRVLNGKKELLIPYHAEFIIKINSKLKTIIVKTPPGLIDLFD